MTLEQFFQENPRCALGFSGGVDSAYLLYAGVKARADIRPYFIKTAFQPAFELADAQKLAEGLGVEVTVLELDALADPRVAANPADRCYFCKQNLFRTLKERAIADGYPVLLDGTNASDEAGDRPGMRALAELSVRSPCGSAGSPRPRSAPAPGRRGCSPGTSRPTPAWLPGCLPVRPSRRRPWPGWRGRRTPCSAWGTPTSGCGCSTLPPGSSSPEGRWSGPSGRRRRSRRR